jgi:hypothetical protein
MMMMMMMMMIFFSRPWEMKLVGLICAKSPLLDIHAPIIPNFSSGSSREIARDCVEK